MKQIILGRIYFKHFDPFSAWKYHRLVYMIIDRWVINKGNIIIIQCNFKYVSPTTHANTCILMQISFTEKKEPANTWQFSHNLCIIIPKAHKDSFFFQFIFISLNSRLSYVIRAITVNNSTLEAEYRFRELSISRFQK